MGTAPNVFKCRWTSKLDFETLLGFGFALCGIT